MSRCALATGAVTSLVLFGVFPAASPAHADATATGALTAEYFLDTSREASALDLLVDRAVHVLAVVGLARRHEGRRHADAARRREALAVQPHGGLHARWRRLREQRREHVAQEVIGLGQVGPFARGCGGGCGGG